MPEIIIVDQRPKQGPFDVRGVARYSPSQSEASRAQSRRHYIVLISLLSRACSSATYISSRTYVTLIKAITEKIKVMTQICEYSESRVNQSIVYL